MYGHDRGKIQSITLVETESRIKLLKDYKNKTVVHLPNTNIISTEVYIYYAKLQEL